MVDIEAMFHQVTVDPENRDTLRFIWWKEDTQSGIVFSCRMKVHLVGGVWSPSCASFALLTTFQDHEQEFCDVVRDTKNNFYVDDLLLSVPNVERAKTVAAGLRKFMAHGGFRLTKWLCNRKEVLKTLPPSERAEGVRELHFGGEESTTEQALGVLWNLQRDALAIKL
ncbi:hypothetical protein Pcinc_017363 [Petrolisthes cinctipes]|uniref:Reverse transcriptase domain-containing protein n=1 Tax=Petrolisthes cinctipes TaxID=88211 RepID=A0AAE1FQE8_PETCI|nr:hypothetical protein Pcinc_017363 [Petrolisthes cinctipes]